MRPIRSRKIAGDGTRGEGLSTVELSTNDFTRGFDTYEAVAYKAWCCGPRGVRWWKNLLRLVGAEVRSGPQR